MAWPNISDRRRAVNRAVKRTSPNRRVSIQALATKFCCSSSAIRNDMRLICDRPVQLTSNPQQLEQYREPSRILTATVLLGELEVIVTGTSVEIVEFINELRKATQPPNPNQGQANGHG